jgi:ATP phosphoribosyltransferase
MSNLITLALSKGRIFEETMPLLETANIQVLDNPETSRKLILETTQKNLRIIMVRASDVPTYVRYGGADIGIAGKDVLDEANLDGLYSPLNLHIGKCNIAVAAIKGFNYAQAIESGRITVATKYIKIAQEYFTQKGIHADIIKLYGSMELAPLVGLSDVIVDLVSTGNTLKANNLELLDTIKPISSRLIVNKASYKTKLSDVQKIITVFENALHGI